jgi:transposase InsO family protein
LGTAEGWLYLCAVRDGCSRRVIGWALDEYLHTDLVQAAVAMAVAMRGELAEQVVLHADRGCQGGFNWSSHHGVVNSSVVGRQALPPVFSTRVSCGAGC